MAVQHSDCRSLSIVFEPLFANIAAYRCVAMRSAGMCMDHVVQLYPIGPAEPRAVGWEQVELLVPSDSARFSWVSQAGLLALLVSGRVLRCLDDRVPSGEG